MNLAGLLDTIGKATGPGYAARAIPGSLLHFVGRDAEGFPVLMLGSRDTPHGLTPAIRLQAVEVQFAVLCQVSLPEGQRGEHRLSVVRCISTDSELQRYFLKVVEAIVHLVGASPTFTQVTGAMRRVVELFQRLTRPPTREVIGLYGELLLILWSASATDSLRAWRSDSTARFDFSSDEVRIDAKVSGRRVRTHSFSLDQCQPPPGTTGLIASILLEPGAGASIGDLLQKIEVRLSGGLSLVMKLHDLVADSLGGALAEGLKTRYDDKAARASLRWYLSSDIPSPQGALPPAVSEVRFRSDLTAVEARVRAEILSKAPAAVQILPPD